MSRRERATQLYMSACAGMEEKDDVRVVGRKCVLAKGTEGVVPSPACSIPSRATSFFLSFFTRQTSAGRQRRQGIERRADKDGRALPEVLVLEVLQCELRRRGRDRSRFGAQFRGSGRALWCAIMIYIYTWIIICYHGCGLNEMGLVVK